MRDMKTQIGKINMTNPCKEINLGPNETCILGLEEKTELQKRIENSVTNGLGYKTKTFELYENDPFFRSPLHEKAKNSQKGLEAHLAHLDYLSNPTKKNKEIWWKTYDEALDQFIFNFSFDRPSCFGPKPGFRSPIRFSYSAIMPNVLLFDNSGVEPTFAYEYKRTVL